MYLEDHTVDDIKNWIQIGTSLELLVRFPKEEGKLPYHISNKLLFSLIAQHKRLYGDNQLLTLYLPSLIFAQFDEVEPNFLSDVLIIRSRLLDTPFKEDEFNAYEYFTTLSHYSLDSDLNLILCVNSENETMIALF